MNFINDPNLEHPFFKDVIRIDYTSDMPVQFINDYGYSYIMLCYGNFDALDFEDNLVRVPKILTKGTGDYFRITAHKDCVWITFEVKNHVLHNITGKNSSSLRNKFIDLSNFVPKEICEKLIQYSKGFRHGVYMYNGTLTSSILGKAFNIPYKNLDLLISAL